MGDALARRKRTVNREQVKKAHHGLGTLDDICNRRRCQRMDDPQARDCSRSQWA